MCFFATAIGDMAFMLILYLAVAGVHRCEYASMPLVPADWRE